ncbi:hypothetical protein [Salininema proteolyticum]|uniref:Spore-associated protein A n=1 Tax=Salininema proteolyticum TaxID=1607685 RepID=A0ABV8TXC8_9ACTN
MNKFRKTLISLAGVAGLALAAVPASSQAAAANANPCGSSFVEVASESKSANGLTATLKVYWSDAYNQNCSVFYKTNDNDSMSPMGTLIRPTGGTVADPGGKDSGWFYSYAGPAYTDKNINMDGKCVDAHGSIFGHDEPMLEIYMPKVACG